MGEIIIFPLPESSEEAETDDNEPEPPFSLEVLLRMRAAAVQRHPANYQTGDSVEPDPPPIPPDSTPPLA